MIAMTLPSETSPAYQAIVAAPGFALEIRC